MFAAVGRSLLIVTAAARLPADRVGEHSLPSLVWRVNGRARANELVGPTLPRGLPSAVGSLHGAQLSMTGNLGHGNYLVHVPGAEISARPIGL